ncbi:MAG: PAS domain-containing protein [Rhizomicrobium sp.]
MSEPNLSGGIEYNPFELKHPTLAFLRDWWDEKRGMRSMPARAELNPAEFRQHLSSLMTLEVLDCGRDFRHRIVGDDIADYFTWNPAGTTVREAFATQPKPLRDVVLAIYRAVVDRQQPVYAFGNPGWAAAGAERCDVLHVPLSGDGEDVGTILSAFVFNRREVRLGREMARANGGELVQRPTG